MKESIGHMKRKLRKVRTILSQIDDVSVRPVRNERGEGYLLLAIPYDIGKGISHS